MLFIRSLKSINVVIPEANMFLWITASVADAAGVNPKCMKTLQDNDLITFPITGF